MYQDVRMCQWERSVAVQKRFARKRLWMEVHPRLSRAFSPLFIWRVSIFFSCRARRARRRAMRTRTRHCSRRALIFRESSSRTADRTATQRRRTRATRRSRRACSSAFFLAAASLADRSATVDL